MKVEIRVSLKPGVLDPQGRAVHHALEGLGFDGIRDVRMGRLIELDVADGTSYAQLDGEYPRWRQLTTGLSSVERQLPVERPMTAQLAGL